MQLLCLSFVVMRCQPLRRALTLICIYINKFNRLTDF
ncbi:acetyltransferase [Vibrio cholerae]|nr:acetyltransferase [Vibrio cholerae]KAA1203784.1 acetyltransferase [Vibrio cholerae]KAA1217019.1 acetyltransferase [Vibrio cholerae]TYW31280.1 acetyltransferase [Vibrio cholerae]